MNFITKQALYSSRDIKTEAKEQLRGHWKNVILLSLLPTLFTLFFMRDVNQNIEDVKIGFEIVDLALRGVQSFLATGVSFAILDFIRKREPIEPLKGVFQAFQGKYFVNLLILKILKNVYTFLWALLFIIPGVVKGYGYSQAERIFKDQAEKEGIVPNPTECLKESQELMMGHKLDLFTLDLSFFGWILLSAMSFGIGFIWLAPYTEVSQALFYQNLLNSHATPSAASGQSEEEIGKDPDDFSDFEDF